jgi:hypothetical protein
MLINMKDKILCILVGHREYAREVLEGRPWEDPDLQQYALPDFRETHCLRCGELLQPQAA